jgi:hypothetical protein
MSGTPKLHLNRRLERLGQQIVRARLYYDLWLYFEGEDSRPKIIEAMRDYSDFFRFTPHAYFVSYVIYTAGAFEKRRDTINLNALIADVRQAGKLQGPMDAEVTSLMTRARPFADKAIILRHNAIAHHSDRMSYDDVFKLAQVTPTELRDLTGIALDVSNRLAVSCGLQEQDFTELPKHDAEQIMSALMAARS